MRGTNRLIRAGLITATLLFLGVAGMNRAALAQGADSDTPWLGVMTQELTDPLREGLDYEGKGVLVSRVVDGSPADRAGIAKGDVITRLNSRAVESPEDLARLVRDGRVGQQVSVQVVRDGRTRNLSVTLDTRPGSAELAPRAEGNDRGDREEIQRDEDKQGEDKDRNEMDMPDMEHMPDMERLPMLMGRGRLGVRIEDVTPGDRERVSHGARITSVVPGSPAERAGLRPGDVITRVNDQSIDDSADLMRTVRGAERNVRITFERRGSTRTVDARLDEAPQVRRFSIDREDLPGAPDSHRIVIRRDLDSSDADDLRREVRDLRRQVDELRRQIEELKRR